MHDFGKIWIEAVVINMNFIDGITLEKYILKYRNRSSN